MKDWRGHFGRLNEFVIVFFCSITGAYSAINS